MNAYYFTTIHHLFELHHPLLHFLFRLAFRGDTDTDPDPTKSLEPTLGMVLLLSMPATGTLTGIECKTRQDKTGRNETEQNKTHSF